MPRVLAGAAESARCRALGRSVREEPSCQTQAQAEATTAVVRLRPMSSLHPSG
jgi:hypothetical protein